MWGNLNQELFLFRYCVFTFRKVRCPGKTLGENTTKYRRQTKSDVKKIPWQYF